MGTEKIIVFADEGNCADSGYAQKARRSDRRRS
jgi:hypothetical protein